LQNVVAYKNSFEYNKFNKNYSANAMIKRVHIKLICSEQRMVKALYEACMEERF
jgi:hypothetical protein